MRSYLEGIETFCYYLPFTHVNLNETTYIEYFKVKIEQKFISVCASALSDVNPRL